MRIRRKWRQVTKRRMVLLSGRVARHPALLQALLPPLPRAVARQRAARPRRTPSDFPALSRISREIPKNQAIEDLGWRVLPLFRFSARISRRRAKRPAGHEYQPKTIHKVKPDAGGRLGQEQPSAESSGPGTARCDGHHQAMFQESAAIGTKTLDSRPRSFQNQPASGKTRTDNGLPACFKEELCC